MTDTETDRMEKALGLAEEFGGTEGGHHKMWVIDQMVRALTGCPMVTREARDCRGDAYSYEAQGESAEYHRWVTGYEDGEDGPESYEWPTGEAP